MPIQSKRISEKEINQILRLKEGHFVEIKSKLVAPSKLSNTISAFANADGGELYVGLEEGDQNFIWKGFSKPEDANGHIQVFDTLFPLGEYFNYEFLESKNHFGYVLKCEILKTPDVKKSSSQVVYLRRGSQNLPQNLPDQVKRIELNKGVFSYEDFRVKSDLLNITESEAFSHLFNEIVPKSTPERWLRKQRLIGDGMTTVCAELLFNDEPQAVLPKTAIKIYRYKTSNLEGTRDTLFDVPTSIEGPAYELIKKAVAVTIEITENIPLLGKFGFEKIQYPKDALHEVITNSVIHRDYSIKDDIHIRIFDNRVEVQSPGSLPGHVTVQNILDERFARNPKLVRILNKFPDPPNKDIGEGLNTTFQAMRKLKLKPPVIEQRMSSVLVKLFHEPLASYEELIMDYLRLYEEINNSKAREVCREGSENKIKRTFEKMIMSNLIERIPERRGVATAYRICKTQENEL